MTKCRYCKKEIEDDAKKCLYCGSWVSKRRWLYGAKSIFESMAFVAAIIVLWMMYDNNLIMKKQLSLMMTSVIESSRPRIEIVPPKVVIADTGLAVRTDILNSGLSDAESVFIQIFYKSLSEPKDTLRAMGRFNMVTSKSTKILTNAILIPSFYKGEFFSLVDVSYNWTSGKAKYQYQKYYKHVYDNKNRNFSTLQLDEVQKEEFMK